jgi:hypothetical protein
LVDSTTGRCPRALKILKSEVGPVEEDSLAAVGLPATNDHIAIPGFVLHAPGVSAGLVGRDQRAATSSKGIEHDGAALGDIPDCIRQHGNGLDGRMHGEFVKAAVTEGIDARILPDIGPVAAVLTEFKRVGMGGFTLLEHEHQFMPGAIERPHAGIVLDPHDQVLLDQALLAARAGQLELMPPVHKDEQDRSISGIGLCMAKKRRQERGKFGLRHLAGCHRKLLMTDLAKPGHVAVHANIIRYVGQNYIRGLAVKQAGVVCFAAGVPAQKPVRAKHPEIAPSRNRCLNDRRNVIFRAGLDRLLLGRLVQNRIDLAQREAGDFDVVELQVMQTLVFDREDVAVPAGKFGDPVVGNDKGLLSRPPTVN